jgi:hypothetical protein
MTLNTSVADAFLTPGSGSGMNNPDNISATLLNTEKGFGTRYRVRTCETMRKKVPLFENTRFCFVACVQPNLLFIPDSEGFHRDLSLNGEKVSFECRTTSVAVRLTELMAMADINNRPQVSLLVTRDIFMWIRILGSLSLTNGSGSFL